MVELKCLTCIHGEMCLEQKGGVDLYLASDNDCKCYKSTNEYKEVKHGEWRLHPDGSGTCNQCGRTQKAVWDFDNAQEYCGKCGAKMDGGKK